MHQVACLPDDFRVIQRATAGVLQCNQSPRGRPLVPGTLVDFHTSTQPHAGGDGHQQACHELHWKGH